MTNVDLINAIEHVRACRAQVAQLRDCWMKADGKNPNWIADFERCKLAENRLMDAHQKLADCMIALQDVYDLALLPKAQVKS